MKARTTILLATLGFAAAIGCSRHSALAVRDGAVEGNADRIDVATSMTLGTGGRAGTGGAVGSGRPVDGGMQAGTGGRVGTGGQVGAGGSLASGGAGGGGTDGGAGGEDCLDRSPLGAGVGGGACEGTRCGNVESLSYETCGWLVEKGRESVFEAVRSCFGKNPDFCSQQPAAVEACTSSVFARACAGPGATVDGVKVDCQSVAAECPAISEKQCHLMTDILNDKYYQAAFECYFRQKPGPNDCSSALRECTGAPSLGTGGAAGSGGTGGSSYDGGAQPACPALSGSWNVWPSCEGPGAFFSGAFVGVMTQTGCTFTFTQTDDKTSSQWVSTGTIDSAGKGALKGDFGFTDSRMCDLETTDTGWAGRCGSATQFCELEAARPTR